MKQTQESTECRLRDEEARKCELEERLEKCHAEIHSLRRDHMGLSEYLQRLAKALQFGECSSPPALGTDTNIMADTLLERADRLASMHHDHDHMHHHQGLHDGHGHHHHTPSRGSDKVSTSQYFLKDL